MPVYEYHCDSCEANFEMTRRITDEVLPRCPECGGEDVRKLISLSSFHLKGTGWYVTDYADKKGEDASDQQEKNSQDNSESGSSPDSGKDSGNGSSKSTKTGDSGKDTGTSTNGGESKSSGTSPSSAAT